MDAKSRSKLTDIKMQLKTKSKPIPKLLTPMPIAGGVDWVRFKRECVVLKKKGR